MEAGRFGFLVKADQYFYEGLAALLASIRRWHPEDPIRILDCGLTPGQRNALAKAGFDDVVTPDLSRFRVVSGSDHYTPAVFAVLAQPSALFPLSIHIDADAVLLRKLPSYVHDVMRGPVGLAAVTDYPPLGLDFQIGYDASTRLEALRLIPNIAMDSVGFNGGFYLMTKDYFVDRLQGIIKRLLPLHDRLWGNEMAILNLAAYAASPDQPFVHLDHTLNHRPSYRRAPQLRPICSAQKRWDGYPELVGHFGTITLLHFVGRTKPWQSAECTPARLAWQFYRDAAATELGL
jgi:hypothetical protein